MALVLILVMMFAAKINSAVAQEVEDPLLLDSSPLLFGVTNEDALSVAWGDVDNDGDLDLAIGDAIGPNKVYKNVDGQLSGELYWSDDTNTFTTSVAWGDVDNDGDLDLAVAGDGKSVKILENRDGTLIQDPVWSVPLDSGQAVIAWGDMDGDSDLDLAIGQFGSPNILYENRTSSFSPTPVWSDEKNDETSSIAWGDVDGDGDLDLAVGNDGENVVYENQSGTITSSTLWSDNSSDKTMSIAWGDVDNDGDLDLAEANHDGPLTINENQNGQLSNSPIFLENTLDGVYSIKWGDLDGDADLDLAVSGGNGVYVLENRNGQLTENILWSDSERNGAVYDIAFGDVDNDGDLELAIGGRSGPSHLYTNQLEGLRDSVIWSTARIGSRYSDMNLAWGDVDNDGDIDLAIGETSGPNRLYRNDDGQLSERPIWFGGRDDNTTSMSWGDVDNDGDLDLAVGHSYGNPSKVYENQDGQLSQYALWSDQSDFATIASVAWGDLDNDGDLDLAVGNYNDPNMVYENQDGQLSQNILWTDESGEPTTHIAWGDVDNDGDLDLVVGNSSRGFGAGRATNKIYENQDGVLSNASSWSTGFRDYTASLALADIDNDGDLELAVGNTEGYNSVYENENGLIQTSASWAQPADFTSTLAWGDTDNDGDLDLFVGTSLADMLYRNQSGQLASSPALSIPTRQLDDDSSPKHSSFGDIDNDGDLDLAVSGYVESTSSFNTYIYENVNLNSPRFGPVFDEIVLTQNQFDVRVDQSVVISYSLFSHSGQPIPRLIAEYKVDNRGPWKRAISTSDTITRDLAVLAFNEATQSQEQTLNIAPPPIDTNLTQKTYLPFMPGDSANTQVAGQPASHTFKWDLAATDFTGSSDHVVVRLIAYPACVNSCQRAQVVAQTHPFRIRGQTLRVMQKAEDGTTQPAINALVYQAADGIGKAEPLTNAAGNPLRTNRQGYMVGQAPIDVGSRLVAVLPVAPSVPLTNTEPITTSVSLTQLLYTSADVTELGLDAYKINANGAHTLTVSAQNPLLLFNLTIALEWNASKDVTYMQLLEDNIQRTSAILYDLTDGQAALGDVGIYHDKGLWGYANIVITARNTQRPSAILGGSVLERTTEILDNGTEVTYLPGQIRMPPEWNKFDDPEQGLSGDDWAQVLAHELGHYLFRLPDNYLGTKDGVLTLVDCQGSVMTNPYSLDYSEFLTQDESWHANCENTLANQFLGRADWESIQQVYPFLKRGNLNSGPSQLPLNVTRVQFFKPETETNTLTEFEFFLKDEQGQSISIPKGQGQAYLITRRPGLMPEERYEYVVDLGRPITDKVIARGASVGDRLCVFDTSITSRYGCMKIGDSAMSLTMRTVSDWSSDVRITPVSSNTISVGVFNIPQTSLSAQLLPAAGQAPNEIPMIAGSNGFSVTLSASDGAYYGFVRLCTPNCTDDLERESIVEFVNRSEWGGQGFAWGGQGFAWGGQGFAWGGQGFAWGGQGFAWGGQGFAWGGQGFAWGGQGFAWGGQGFAWGGQGYQWNAPVMSADGQVSVFPLDDVFGENSDFTLQRLEQVPSLYSWLTPVGQAYRFMADGMPSNASLLFRYLASDVPPLTEAGLRIYFSADDGKSWQRLETELNTTLNLASTVMPGMGIYVLAATQEMEPLQMGCNLIGYPMHTTRPVADALASVSGSYTTVWGHVNGLWSVHDSTVEAPFDEAVNTLNTLSIGQAYSIYATEPITLYLPVDLDGSDVVQAASAELRHAVATPAIYYGWITPVEGFTPGVGSTVTVESNGQVLGETTVIELDGQLAYVVQVNPLAIADCGPTAHEITFRIDDQLLDHDRLWDNSQAWFQPLSEIR